MLDYGLTEEQQMIRDTAKQIADEKIRPVAAELDEKQEFPADDLLAVFGETGISGVYIDDKYGGMAGETPIFNMVLATEELSRACAGIALSFAGSALGSLPIIIAGSEEQKEKYLTQVAGGTMAAFGLTEPNAGSDAAGMQTTAVKDGDSYILNGTKQWITNGGEAEIYTVFAMTDKSRGARGASVFVVEKGTPGFDFGKKEDKMGIRASATRELIFQDCRIPAANLLGREGTGFMTAMKTFDMSRPGIGSQALGIAQEALDQSVKYSRERRQFGRPISANQGLQWILADMAMQIEAARALIYVTARNIDMGMPRTTKYSAMSKVFASDTAMKATIDAIQVFGGYGYMKEYPVEKLARDAKITQIYEGTNQIQRDEIARALIKEAAAAK